MIQLQNYCTILLHVTLVVNILNTRNYNSKVIFTVLHPVLPLLSNSDVIVIPFIGRLTSGYWGLFCPLFIVHHVRMLCGFH
jgi:hypothetical protein